MKNRQFRFQSLYAAVIYSDGHVDCLKGQGKIELEANYVVCYIDMGKDLRIVLIDEKLKHDYEDLPVVLVARENISQEELEGICEIRMGKENKHSAN